MTPAARAYRVDRASRRWLVLGVVWCLSGVIAGKYLTRGWVPHDEGGLAQSAERVLGGETPHRDFDEPYTGGLSYLNALAFRVFGTSLVSLRIVLFLCVLAWVPALFYVAVQFVSPVAAGAAVLLGVVWSVPNYSAPVPSWYNLFLAVFGIVALLRYVETEHARWLVVAGVCGGVSCLVKVIGAYSIAAGLLFLVFREQCTSAARVATFTRQRGYSWGLTIALLGFVGLLIALVRTRLDAVDVVHFVFPGAALAALVLWLEWTEARESGWTRLRRLGGLTVPFILGVAAPIALFTLPYATSGALPDLWRGLFVLPIKRFSFATMELPGLGTTVAALPLLAGFGLAARESARGGRRVVWVTAVILLALLVAAGKWQAYRAVWDSVRQLTPVLVLLGVLVLARDARLGGRLSPERRQQILLVLGGTALFSLVQFPFSAPIYFCYVAPLVVLSTLAVGSAVPGIPAPLVGVVMAFYGLFAMRWVNPGFIYHLGFRYQPDDQTARLALDRGGLRVSAADKQLYESLVDAVRLHARGGFVYATPDCPEVYFLSGQRNPTRTIFDFFDDSVGRAARVLRRIEEHRVNVVILNHDPSFSGPPPPALATDLAVRFPRTLRVGRFEVRWAP